MSYGNADDLKRIKKMKNVTNRIALLKLGKLPLLYKVSPVPIIWLWGEFCLVGVTLVSGNMRRESVCMYVCVSESVEREGKRHNVSQEDNFSKMENFILKSLIYCACGTFIKLAFPL